MEERERQITFGLYAAGTLLAAGASIVSAYAFFKAALLEEKPYLTIHWMTRFSGEEAVVMLGAAWLLAILATVYGWRRWQRFRKIRRLQQHPTWHSSRLAYAALRPAA